MRRLKTDNREIVQSSNSGRKVSCIAFGIRNHLPTPDFSVIPVPRYRVNGKSETRKSSQLHKCLNLCEKDSLCKMRHEGATGMISAASCRI